MNLGTRRLLLEITALLVIFNGAALIQLVQSYRTQQLLGVSYPPLLRLLYSLFWTIAFVWLFIRLIRHPLAAILVTPPLLTIYGAANVVWLLIFARTDFDRGRIGFQGVVTVLLLLPLWLLCRVRPSPATPPNPPTT